jgi:hypothetical protein
MHIVCEDSIESKITKGEYLESLLLGEVKALSDNTGVESFRDVALGLLEELCNEEDIGSRSISSNFILSSGSPGNHGRSGVLDLLPCFIVIFSRHETRQCTHHFTEKDFAVFGQFNVS